MTLVSPLWLFWRVWMAGTVERYQVFGGGSQCDAGLYCTFGPQWVAGCIGTDGCCTPFCDTTASNNCVGAGNGEVCQPWYEAGTAPPGQDNVGTCVIPQ